ncbi:gamma-glutamylcyclotransferase family protein [Geminicoccus harenae]|uniref:gamma-glutamylcyclotransferase family protein n=1 Tax=Geminicoccus harenae TaxID=2498453 RepID=UPI00168B62FB|nr:gamma-glutamylcyclotransferase family protein [Geminicoccus harenae]
MPDWFFFYGTLMDRDVLAHVVDREVADDELFPAILHGVRRVAVPGFTYPRLVDAPGHLAAGLALHRPSPRDLVRLHWFEEGEYGAATARIQLLDGRNVPASYFSAFDSILPAGSSDWCPLTWRRDHKASCLAQCPEWMTGCPEPDSADPFVREALANHPALAA